MKPPVLAGLLALLFTHPCPAADPLTVGFAARDITPTVGERPVFLAGFGHNRRATSVLAPLAVRAVVLSDGGAKVAVVAADAIGLFLPSVERIRAKLPGMSHVVVSATHTHSAPDTLGLWGRSPFQSGVDPDHLAAIEAKAVEAVSAADQARRPATAAVGTAAAPELVRDTRRPEVKQADLTAVPFRSPDDGKSVGLVVQWNCHPETLGSGNTAVSPDFVAATVRHLEKTHGCPVVYLTGTVGGLMTSLGLPVRDAAGNLLADGSPAKADRYGELVGELADRAVVAAVPAALTPIRVRTKAVLVPVDNPLYKLAWQAKTLRRPIYKWAGDPSAAADEATDATGPVAVRTEVGVLRLGELGVAVVPGEIYPELVLGGVPDPAAAGADFPDAAVEPAVYPHLNARHKLLVGLGNDELGYIIPKRQWDDKPPFCYGRGKPQYGEMNSVGPAAAAIICDTLKALAGGDD